MGGDIGVFDRFALGYDLLMPPARASKLRTGLDRADREITRLLDVGGGPGRASRGLDVPERIVVDAAPRMLARARSHGLEAITADASRLPVREKSVDAVVIVDALHHMRDADAVIAAAAATLRPGGVLVIREFDPTTVLGRLLVATEHLVGFASSFFPPDELASRVASAGLAPTVVERGFGYTVAGVARAGREK